MTASTDSQANIDIRLKGRNLGWQSLTSQAIKVYHQQLQAMQEGCLPKENV
jgi:hypothetical protein